MNALRSALAGVSALGVLAGLCGCGPLPLVSGTFEAKQVCKTLPDQYFPGAPVSMRATTGTSMQVDLSSELAPLQKQGVALDVQLSSVTFSPKQGVSNFGFLDSLKISAAVPTGDATLASYARDQSDPAPAELQLRAQQPVNLAAVAQDGQVQVDLTATGQMPTSDWSVDAIACFHVSGTIDR